MKLLAIGMLVVSACSVTGSRSATSSLSVRRSLADKEVFDRLDRIYVGAALYYARNGHSFPASSAPTPALGSCCHGGCDPNAKTATWTDLNLAPEKTQRYSYEFVSYGEKEDAVFIARAYDDKDCDGVYSVFEMRAFVEDGQIAHDIMIANRGE